jgi:DNA-binding LacI/PurR family transcriptional regulator
MNNNPIPNIRSIAKKAQVHYATVSRALRGDPRVSKSTQQHVANIAREMGYKPNPLVSALMTQVHASKRISYVGNIALFFDSQALMKQYPHLQLGYVSLKLRAEELGFHLDTFFLDEYRFQGDKLLKALESRGIYGIINQLMFPHEQLAQFDWSHFACSTFGKNHSSEIVPSTERLNLPSWIPSVNPNHFSNMNLVNHKVRQLGYCKPGMVLRPFVRELSENAFEAPFMQLCYSLNLPPHEQIYVGNETQPQFKRWLKQSGIDLLISHETTFYEIAKKSGVNVDFINLDWKGGSESGINQHQDYMITKVVDLVVAQLHRNERGQPLTPFNVLIDGEWQQGNTINREVSKS